MKIKRFACLGILFYIMIFNLNAQRTEKFDIAKNLIGQWIFIKTLDTNNNEVKFIKQDNKDSSGNEILIRANGPRHYF